MQPYNVPKKDSGFTLTEVVVTAIIGSILAAVMLPGLIGMLRQSEVKEALETVQSAFQEAQRQAMQKSQICTVNLDSTNVKITATPTNCLLSQRNLNAVNGKIRLESNVTSFSFSPKGNVSNNINPPESTTVIISSTQGTQEKRCLVISSALGLIRTGIYSTTATGITENSCTTN